MGQTTIPTVDGSEILHHLACKKTPKTYVTFSEGGDLHLGNQKVTLKKLP